MTAFEITLIMTGVLLVAVVTCYIAAFSQTFISSNIVLKTGEFIADHYYHLPQGQMILTVTATIQLLKSETDQSVISEKLLALTFSPEIQIRPDPDAMIAITYKGNWFASDELQISTTNTLLENVKSVSEDRIGSIIAQVAQAPAPVVAAQKEFNLIQHDLVLVPKGKTEMIEVTTSFLIGSHELANGTIERSWKIPHEGVSFTQPIVTDASFELNTPTRLTKISLADTQSYNGLFSRPLVLQEWSEQKNGTVSTAFSCLLPDTRSILKIPIRRSWFIKKQQLPKFTQGLLTENSLSKPSEVEGLVSIPVNILKSIASIPAQLLQFKITQAKQETEYEKVLAELAKLKAAQEQRTAATNARPQQQPVFTNRVVKPLSPDIDLPPVAEDAPLPLMGKLPPLPYPEDSEELGELGGLGNLDETGLSRGLHTGQLLKSTLSAVAAFIPGLPAIKEAQSWADTNSTWDDYDNLKYKTCVPASAAYLVASWTANSNTPVKIISREAVFDTLKAVAPDGDISRGCAVLTLMEYWRKTGIEGEKIEAYKPLKKGNIELLKHAIYWFGGCMCGIQLPVSMKKSTNWIYQQTMDNERKEGHAVCAIGYNGNVFTIISFGKVITMDAAFYQKFNDESYIALSQKNWTTDKDAAPTDPNQTFSQLQELMKTIYTLKSKLS